MKAEDTVMKENQVWEFSKPSEKLMVDLSKFPDKYNEARFMGFTAQLFQALLLRQAEITWDIAYKTGREDA